MIASKKILLIPRQPLTLQIKWLLRIEKFLAISSNGKKKLLARIGGIQQALERQPFRSLYRLESNLKKKLEEVLSQKELLWYQKSRRDWITYGDQNTSFFNQKTIIRRARNRITAIKDEGDT